jgi:hypothetical protein
MAGLNRTVDGWLNALDDFYARMLHKALAHRPTVFATGFALFAVAVVLLGNIGFEFQPQTDEGEVRVDVELAVGSRIERTEACGRARGAISRPCPKPSVDRPGRRWRRLPRRPTTAPTSTSAQAARRAERSNDRSLWSCAAALRHPRRDVGAGHRAASRCAAGWRWTGRLVVD